MKVVSTFGLSLLVAGGLLLGATGAQAQLVTAKCRAAKIKCALNKTTGLLGCHNKAEGKGIAVDPLCIQKVLDKYSFPAKGCMEKAELKPPCATTGDTSAIEAKVDAFVLDVVQELDPGYPAPILNKCSAGKKKCVANKVKALLGCYNKAAGKSLPVDPACITKAQTKFDGGIDPAKGCFEKLEAKPPCLTNNDTGALEAKADAFALDVNDELNPPPLSTLDFVTGAPGGTCGTAQDGSAVVVKNLTCGGLNIGGGGSIVGEGPTPDGATSRYAISCTGTSCAVSANTTAPALNSADPDCTGVGCNFGTPLPIPNAVIPTITTCVQNTFATAGSGTLDISNGTASLNVNLTSAVFLTGNLAQPCPRCSASGSPASPGTGTCDRGPRAGMACTTTNSGGLTRDCPTGGVGSVGTPCPGGPGVPSGCPANNCPCTVGGGNCCDGSNVGPINVNLTPVTTGVASDTDAGGIFCPGQTGAGCFGQASCRTITENGQSLGLPLPPGTPVSTRLASVFCIAATGNGLVDASANLPGPGAVTLPGTFEIN